MAKTPETTDRIDRGLALWREHRDAIRPVGAGRWRVPGSGGREYLVDLQTGVCECRDYQFNMPKDERCKHLWAAVFEALGNYYKLSAHFNHIRPMRRRNGHGR